MLPPLPRNPIINDYGGSRPYEATIGLVTMEIHAEEDEEEDQSYRYKVVYVSRYRDFCSVNVFSSDDESSGWRELPSVDDNTLSYSKVMIPVEIPQRKKKKCYWIADHRGYVAGLSLVSYDPNTEVFHIGRTLPYNRHRSYPSAIMTKEETLVVLFGLSKEVWVLQQVNVEESWCKLFTIPLDLPCINFVGFWKHDKVIYRDTKTEYSRVLDIHFLV